MATNGTLCVRDLHPGFWSRVDILGPDDCWVWEGSRTDKGYGRFSVSHTKHMRAHRMAYKIVHGSIPVGKNINHSCDNKLCCNPVHLWVGSQTENMMDMRVKKRGKPPPVALGEDSSMSKLTEIDVVLIRKDTRTLARIASDYGVSFSLISAIKHRKAWSHVR